MSVFTLSYHYINKIVTSQNTMYCGGEPEYHIRNVTSRISIC